MPSVITSLAPTTELEAVNTMLVSIGEAPLAAGTDLSTSTQGDVELSIQLLKECSRETQLQGWRFNHEPGLEISPTTTYSWVDTDGVTTSLNIFKLPSSSPRILRWEQTVCSENNNLDLVERPSKKYTESAASVLVLYDRTKNRDGAEASVYPYVYIDATFAFNFEQLPESARRYIAVRAARQLAQKALGSVEKSRFTSEDEAVALRSLVRDQGLTKRLNILNTSGASGHLGGRPRPFGGLSRRVFPGST